LSNRNSTFSAYRPVAFLGVWMLVFDNDSFC
jgi:hypothetical protein